MELLSATRVSDLRASELLHSFLGAIDTGRGVDLHLIEQLSAASEALGAEPVERASKRQRLELEEEQEQEQEPEPVRVKPEPTEELSEAVLAKRKRREEKARRKAEKAAKKSAKRAEKKKAALLS